MLFINLDYAFARLYFASADSCRERCYVSPASRRWLQMNLRVWSILSSNLAYPSPVRIWIWNRKKMIFTCSVALDRCTVTDANSHRWMSNQTDRQARIPFCSISCVRRRREQTADITSCWGQSHRNRPGASRSAVMAITTLSTAKNTHTPTHTVYTHTHKHTTALLLAPNCQ